MTKSYFTIALVSLMLSLRVCVAADSPATEAWYLISEWLDHYHTERPHQSLDNEPLRRSPRGRPKQHHDLLEEEIVPLAEVRCKQRLGGLLKSYSRKAA